MNEPKLTTHTFPMLDTGIGREAGYANDADLIAAANAEREQALAALTPEARALFEDAERQAERAFFLYGET